MLIFHLLKYFVRNIWLDTYLLSWWGLKNAQWIWHVIERYHAIHKAMFDFHFLRLVSLFVQHNLSFSQCKLCIGFHLSRIAIKLWAIIRYLKSCHEYNPLCYDISFPIKLDLLHFNYPQNTFLRTILSYCCTLIFLLYIIRIRIIHVVLQIFPCTDDKPDHHQPLSCKSWWATSLPRSLTSFLVPCTLWVWVSFVYRLV